MPMDSQGGSTFTCDLRGRVALVTGASSGIGAHLAATLAAAGARVAVAGRREARLAETVGSIEVRGGTAMPVRLDVTDPGGVDDALASAEERLGPLDILINNAGVSLSKLALETEIEEWDTVIDTNLRGAFLVARAFARLLVARTRPGCIVNVASILADRVAGSLTAYAVSKAGMVQLTRALALELARHRIRVNAIAPGYIATDLNSAFFATSAGDAMIKRIPQRRLGRLEDLDGPVLLLASDASSYMTGAVLPIDGGHLVSSL